MGNWIEWCIYFIVFGINEGQCDGVFVYWKIFYIVWLLGVDYMVFVVDSGFYYVVGIEVWYIDWVKVEYDFFGLGFVSVCIFRVVVEQNRFCNIIDCYEIIVFNCYFFSNMCLICFDIFVVGVGKKSKYVVVVVFNFVVKGSFVFGSIGLIIDNQVDVLAFSVVGVYFSVCVGCLYIEFVCFFIYGEVEFFGIIGNIFNSCIRIGF